MNIYLSIDYVKNQISKSYPQIYNEYPKINYENYLMTLQIDPSNYKIKKY